jgi:hypothetical protein
MAETTYVLTTIFTPAPDCSTRLFTLRDATESPSFIFWDDELYGTWTSKCYPSEFISGFSNMFTLSPGVRPEDYTTVATTVSGEETAAFCCPSYV